MERMIEGALKAAGWDYSRADSWPEALDFWVPCLGCFIEVKQFHSERIAGQMARAENVIVAQGREAVEALATLIRRAA